MVQMDAQVGPKCPTAASSLCVRVSGELVPQHRSASFRDGETASTPTHTHKSCTLVKHLHLPAQQL